MRIVVIIQARMGSTRLPGKVLMDLAGKPAIQRVFERSCRISGIDEVIIATTLAERDNVLVEFCRSKGFPVYRGSEDDVLDRYYQSAKQLSADAIVRITGDCPLIDPCEVDKVVETFRNGRFDYVSNTQPRMLPVGLDAGIGSFASFERSWQEAREKSEREHVTQYIRRHPDIFKIGSVAYDEDCSHHRWTLDDQDDYAFLSKVFDRLGERNLFGHLNEVLMMLEETPSRGEHQY